MNNEDDSKTVWEKHIFLLLQELLTLICKKTHLETTITYGSGTQFSRRA